MMSNKLQEMLEQRLLQIIEGNQYIDGEFLRYATKEEKQKAVAQIFKAVQDAGYMQVRDVLIPANQPPVMTGSYWYERFKAELDKDEYTGMKIEEAVLLMAQRAAGINHNNKEDK